MVSIRYVLIKYEMVQSPTFYLDEQFRNELDGIKHLSLVLQTNPIPKAFEVCPEKRRTIFCEFCFTLL